MTLAEIEAAGAEAGRALGPLTQEQADSVAAILAPHLAGAGSPAAQAA